MQFKLPTRLRAEPQSSFFGFIKKEPLLVVQVQHAGQTEGDPRDPLDMGQSYVAWRDATVSDISS